MSEQKIKVVNQTNHGHAVRMLMSDGGYTYKRLPKKGSFVRLTGEQFVDLYNSAKDFRIGILSFDEKELTEEIRLDLGLPTTEEEKQEFEPEFKIYTDKDIKSIFTSKAKTADKKFDDFVEEIKSLDEKESGELKRRIFDIASDIKNMSRERAEIVEELTGKDFRVNAQNDKENK